MSRVLGVRRQFGGPAARVTACGAVAELGIRMRGANPRQVIQCRRVVGIDFQGLAVMGDGVIKLAAVGQGKAKFVVGFRVVGLDFQGLVVMGDSLVNLSALGQRGQG